MFSLVPAVTDKSHDTKRRLQMLMLFQDQIEKRGRAQVTTSRRRHMSCTRPSPPKEPEDPQLGTNTILAARVRIARAATLTTAMPPTRLQDNQVSTVGLLKQKKQPRATTSSFRCNSNMERALDIHLAMERIHGVHVINVRMAINSSNRVFCVR